ncbi:MAG: hypothetical protein IKC77_06820 [Lentisphaeria bacterium]|nr:hypothetical protein [Lentisphaeria bacterium]
MIIPQEHLSADEETALPNLDKYNVEYNIEEAPELGDCEGTGDLVTDCRNFFAKDGILANGDFGPREYEERPQQTAMAVGVAEALVEGNNLCVEAPTGVGKSFAYLVPLIYRSRYCALPSVVSTETINLQEQLMNKDIPMLRTLTGIDIKAALSKGRHNYICRRRLDMLSGDQRDALLPVPSLVLDLEKINDCVEDGISGERDELNFRIDPQVWSLVCCEAGNCAGAKCRYFRNCYYYKARRTWEDANIIIANHALFFTDLAMRGEGCESPLLPNYGAVMIDEAHTLENNAADHLGLHVSKSGLIGVLNRLYNPDNARGLLLRSGAAAIELRGLAGDARDEVYGYFRFYEELLESRHETALKIPRPDMCSENLTRALLALARKLDEFIEETEDEDSFKTEMQSQLSRLREYIDAVSTFHHQTQPDAVYYIESDRGSVTLHGAPLNVSELLRSRLFNQDFPVMLCSATLTYRGRFDYFWSRTGFVGGSGMRLDSPFSSEQAAIYLPREMPDPSSSDFVPALIEKIPEFIRLTDGKAFVLFTSYQALKQCAESLKWSFMHENWKLLVQGGDLTRSQLLAEFKEDINSVLFGTDSFWTGVDVPGEALSNVIVTKLPFAVPSHPLIAARMAKIEEMGGSSFSEYSLPEAVLKFRQGAGRLIRSRSDRGVIVILDRRVISKGYGKLFLDSLPYKVEII